MTPAPYVPPPLYDQSMLIAAGARWARHALGPCALCGHGMLAGHRVADLAASGATVHISCIGGKP